MSGKSLKSWFALVIAVAIALVWSLLGKYYLFYQPILPLSVTNTEIDDWLADIFWLNNIISLVLGFLLLGFWIFKAYNKQFIRAELVLAKRFTWWLSALFHFFACLLIFFGTSYFLDWLDEGRYIEFWLWYPGCLLLDTLLIFWLPSALATPRSLRNIPPLAIKLRKFYGG
ncbi:hypothetical protein [Picosynechococcus sp. PCC 73109]|uniref:hypothetical protein n=1 Tax=Picosynechococcus sp. PCC 73109 TaxID=374982 RepID=UPI0007458837|nr:hypothetical protein [Picosynechococcus sp. PCC 73109]AMA10808.1 hypothetical protein AWQ23_15330 [Picosynechococcus sp. PCC 73109]